MIQAFIMWYIAGFSFFATAIFSKNWMWLVIGGTCILIGLTAGIVGTIDGPVT